jgi:hypothetical protein
MPYFPVPILLRLMRPLAALLILLFVGIICAPDPVKFYWSYKVYELKDTKCTGLISDTGYMTNLNLGKYFGGDGTNSECVLWTNSRYYKQWCDFTTGVWGAQEFTSAGCSDSDSTWNPAVASGRGGKTVDLVYKDECFWDPYSGKNVKSEGCYAEQSKVPSGYKQFARASRISVPWYLALITLSTLPMLLTRGCPM